MTDYKDTINLPKTKFPMKANLAQREPDMLRHWDNIKLYQRLRELGKKRQKYILLDGPIYANGNIHLGHALNRVLKDIVIKSKTLTGLDAPYVPGWDCHGLPVELNVEKKKGKAGQKISVAEFRQACRDYAKSQIDIQREEFIRLGVIGDWQHPYTTMAPDYEADIIRSLATIIAKGHLLKGQKPVHWCIDCGSAMAEAEVEYKDKTSPAIDVIFNVLDEEVLMAHCHHVADHKGEGPLSVVIWTTTPWTLPANQAVAVNPEIDYVVVQIDGPHGKQRLVMADSLLKETMARYEIEHYSVIAYCRGNALEGLKLQHPFYDRSVPIILGDHVTVDAGTGCVHTAPGHGPDDYAIAQKYHLPISNPVGDNGCFLPDTPIFAGEYVHKANTHIIEVLTAKGNLLRAEMISHSYPHCWRHKTPLIFRATPQWFIGMDQQGLRRDALDAIFKVQWLPDWGQARIATMVENRPDWCISRQRYWGVPLTIFIDKKSGELHPDTVALMEKVSELVAEEGIEAWFKLDPAEFLGADAERYTKCNDILDVWFDSGVAHQAVLERNPQLQFPADLYLEGSDQHRGWFQSSLLTSVAITGQAPYKTVLTHGFTVDAQGRKMSKSLGNVIPPDKVIKTLGADILRLWVAATDYRSEMTVSDEIFKRTSDTYRRLRNTARYLLANLADFDPEQHIVPASSMLSLDRWAVDRARSLQADIVAAYEDFQFHVIYQRLHNFCNIEMGSFYLDIIKDRQYTTPTESLCRRSAQTAMYRIAEALVRWLAPILSFTAEEIWQYMPGNRAESVFLTTWYEDFITLADDEPMGAEFWASMISVRDAVNKELEAKRNADVIRSALDAELDLYCNDELYQQLESLGDELRFVFITSAARVHQYVNKPATAVNTEIEGLAVVVKASKNDKCVRCWHKRADVGQATEHPELCARCVENLAGEGENRRFA